MLWEGVRYDKGADKSKAGYRYEVTVEVLADGKVVDAVTEKIGFRYFWIDASSDGDSGEGFFLNGIIVWTEIPLVNEICSAAGFEDNIKKQLTGLITQQCNRPSVCFWGIENEIGNGTALFNPLSNAMVAKAKKLLYNLDTLVHELDKTGRYTTQAVNRDYSMNKNDPDLVNKDFESNVGWKSDIVAWNIYPGWYPELGKNNLTFAGNCTMKVTLSSGWVHEGNTVEIYGSNNSLFAVYTIYN